MVNFSHFAKSYLISNAAIYFYNTHITWYSSSDANFIRYNKSLLSELFSSEHLIFRTHIPTTYIFHTILHQNTFSILFTWYLNNMSFFKHVRTVERVQYLKLFSMESLMHCSWILHAIWNIVKERGTFKP